MPQNLVQPPPMPRAILNRHHARRSNSSIAPKVEPGISSLAAAQGPASATSPRTRPTPPSHSASPTATTSAFGASPAGSGSDHVSAASLRSALSSGHAAMKAPPAHLTAMQALGHAAPARSMAQQMPAPPPTHAMRAAGVSATGYYPAPAFQNHIEQLGKLPRFFFPLFLCYLIGLWRPRFIP